MTTMMDGLEEWLEGRPESIREAVKRKPPHWLYRMKSTGHIVFIMSYVEPDGGSELCAHCKANRKPEHAHQGDPNNTTVSVGVTAQFNRHILMERRVWGVKLDDLIPLNPDEQALVDKALKADGN